MNRTSPAKLIGWIEIMIGLTTLFGTIGSLALGTNTKPQNVLIFVIAAACISSLLGVGLLKEKKIAYLLLLYFSSIIIFSKIMIFMGIIELNGALEEFLPGTVKNFVSLFYHSFVIVILFKNNVKEHIQI